MNATSFGKHEALSVDQLLVLTVRRTAEMMEAEACILYIYDEARDQLWSKVIVDGRFNEIRIAANQGIAGAVFQSRQTINLTDPYADPRFDSAGDKRSGNRTVSLLAVPMLDNSGDCFGVLQLTNKTGGQMFNAQDEKLLAAISSQAGVTLENAIVLEAVRAKREAEHKVTADLAAELAANNKKLQEAFAANEAQKASLEAALRKVRVIRSISIGFVAVVFVGLGLYLWFDDLGGNRSGPTAAVVNETATVKVQPQPVDSTLSLAGALEPFAVINIVSPFAGRVKARHFEYGQAVKKGQPLLELDPTEAEAALREAELAFVKARDEAANLEHWETAPEMSESRRNLTKARNELKSLQQRTTDTKKLFDRGIVSAEEYQNLKEQIEALQLDLETQETQHALLRKRGAEENVRLAQLDLKLATRRRDELRTVVAQSTLVSPVDGVVLMPTEGFGAKEGQRAERGAAITAGSLLVSIGDLSGFAVRVEVDEVNVGKLRVGQNVTVTGAAFPGGDIAGRISSVSSQAKSGGFDGVPTFSAEVLIEKVPDALRGRILLGMSADLLVKIYEKPDALLVPIGAVEVAGEERAVYLHRDGAAPERRVVKTGVTTLDSVEILSGLQAGDEIQAAPPHHP